MIKLLLMVILVSGISSYSLVYCSTMDYQFMVTERSKNKAENQKINFETDIIYKKLESAIPPNWKISNNKQQLIIERIEPVWILFENKINAPANFESPAEKIIRIKKYGTLSKSKFVFRVEDKWTTLKTERVKQNNALIHSKILDLVKKYNIPHFYDNSFSRKSGEYYQTTNAEQNRKIQNFLKEKAELEKTIVKLPYYHTDNYSLFLVEQTGQEDESHTIYPESASSELYLVKNKLNEILVGIN